MGTLEGRVALVTGGGDGIGLGITRRLAAAGAAVVIAEIDERRRRRRGRRRARASSASSPGSSPRTSPTATSCETAVAVGPDELGRLDILVNNAWGGGRMARLEHTTDAEIEHGLGDGAVAGFWSMRAAFPHLKANGVGRIVNLCSLNGVQRAPVHRRVQHRQGGAARAHAHRGTRVGASRHHRQRDLSRGRDGGVPGRRRVQPGDRRRRAAANPMGRMGDPEFDVGTVAAFLASDDARYLTGNTLFVDGGAHINGAAWDPELPD